VLHCLGVFGLHHLSYGFMKALLTEIVKERSLTQSEQSCFLFWMKTLSKSDEERAMQYVEELKQMKVSVNAMPSTTMGVVGH
jgi:DNA-directed RNA polymerase subunit F